ncbi:MAG: glycosyltransferase family 9 protein [Gammaproteobacteria bacterium]|nr:glycosyltransferase family 9 protein [Gammaproteobacteria bacterium]
MKDVTRILFISLSNIGDVIMTTPVMERLHQLYPNAIMDIVADQRSSILFEHCPYRGTIFHKDKKAGWRGILKLLSTLRKTRYDLIVDLRTDGLAYLLRARKRLTKWHARPEGSHSVQQHIAVIASINDGLIPHTRIWINDAIRHQAQSRLKKLPGSRRLAIGSGANWAPKIWPVEQFRALIISLKDQFDSVILLGGPGDQARCQQLAQDLPIPSINLAGQTDLLEVAAILETCQLFIGNDSGLGHIASAVDVATISVFGPGQPERYHPWGEKAKWIQNKEQDINAISANQLPINL